MQHPNPLLRTLLCITCLLPLLSCSGNSGKQRFVILSGSENESLEPILNQFAAENGINLVMNYKGSVDIMLALTSDTATFDAVWPASSLWIALGDKKFKVKHAQSVMTSPVVFGIRKSIAESLGFTNRSVTVADILDAIQKGSLRFTMTSATQSNSGASAYIGFLYALLGNPPMMTIDDLHKPELGPKISALLAGINRSSGSSGWLKELFLQGQFDAMVNYESIIIETNTELAKQGKEPLYIVYPTDGLVLSDSPLGYVNRGSEDREKLFLKLQQYLLSEPVQQKIAAQGRRIGLGGAGAAYDEEVFKPAWGIDTKKILSPIRIPAAEVIFEALRLYQSKFRKPSLTVFCLDYSPSMEGEGSTQLKEAMRILLTPDRAREYLLDAGDNDEMVVIPFCGTPQTEWTCSGPAPECFSRILDSIESYPLCSATDIYAPAIQALSVIGRYDSSRYLPAVVLLTDGESNTGATLDSLRTAVRAGGRDIPVFSIMFGDASKEELQEIADLTLGNVFDGRTDLAAAFRKVKGYN